MDRWVCRCLVRGFNVLENGYVYCDGLDISDKSVEGTGSSWKGAYTGCTLDDLTEFRRDDGRRAKGSAWPNRYDKKVISFINKNSSMKIDMMISLVRDSYNAMRDEFFAWKREFLKDGQHTYSEEAIMNMLEEFKKPEIPYEDKIPTLPPEYNNQHWEILYNNGTYKPEKLSSFQQMTLEPAFHSYLLMIET